MDPQTPYQDLPKVPIHNPLSVMQPGEQIICEIKRHPIGMVGLYIMSGALVIVLAVLAFIVAPSVITTESRSQVIAIGTAAFLLVSIITAAFVFIGNIVYWGNRWVLTSDSITQVTQTSLFNKQSSQLSLGNLEDVTAEQNGILTHMFHYGVLKAETAGERSKFMFLFCPNPAYYAQQVLQAREQFEQNRQGEDLQRNHRSEASYQPPNQVPAAAPPAQPQTPPYSPPPPDPGVNPNTQQ